MRAEGSTCVHGKPHSTFLLWSVTLSEPLCVATLESASKNLTAAPCPSPWPAAARGEEPEPTAESGAGRGRTRGNTPGPSALLGLCSPRDQLQLLPQEEQRVGGLGGRSRWEGDGAVLSHRWLERAEEDHLPAQCLSSTGTE